MQKTTEPLRIGGVPEHFNLPWRQRATGHESNASKFERIEYREFGGGTGAMVKALENNELDMAVLLTEGALLSIARGGRHKIVKVYVDTPLEWGIHVAANSDLDTLTAIRGKRYAISRKGSGSHIMAAVHARDRGWPTNNLKFVQIKNLEGARTALPAGDAEVFFWEKTMTQPCVDAGEFRRVGIFQSPWPSFVVCASNRLINTQTSRLKDLVEQISDLAGLIEADCDSAAHIAGQYGLSLSGVEQWLNHTHWSHSLQIPENKMNHALSVLKSLDLGVPAQQHIDSMIYPL